MQLGGLFDKIKDKADWATYLISAYEAIPSLGAEFQGFSGMLKYFTDTNVGLYNEVKRLGMPGVLEWKLGLGANAPQHIYSTTLKYSALLWLAEEFLGINIPFVNKSTLEKVFKGSLIAALTLPSSGPYETGAYARNVIAPNANPNKPSTAFSGAY